MIQEKAYKLLALQEGISNRSAKDLIDRGVVYAKGKKVLVARALIKADTKFKIQSISKTDVIFEDENIVAINKPAFVTSEQIAKKKNLALIHRLDKETSGVLLLAKNEDFRLQAIEAFKSFSVDKEYIAWVSGKIIAEPFSIEKPLISIKKGNFTYTKVSKNGKEAISYIEPILIEGKKSKIKVNIKTGRTHQIRAHLKSEGCPIIGDSVYGGKTYSRLLLHAFKISLLGYSFEASEPKEFIDVTNS